MKIIPAIRIVAITVLLCPAPAFAEPTVAGIALVIDGTTMIVARREKVTLDGLSETIPAADDALTNFADGKVVVCTVAGARREGRLPARCKLGNTDIGQWLKDRGLAK